MKLLLAGFVFGLLICISGRAVAGELPKKGEVTCKMKTASELVPLLNPERMKAFLQDLDSQHPKMERYRQEITQQTEDLFSFCAYYRKKEKNNPPIRFPVSTPLLAREGGRSFCHTQPEVSFMLGCPYG